MILLSARYISIYVFHTGDKIVIPLNSLPDSVPHFFIRDMIPVADA